MLSVLPNDLFPLLQSYLSADDYHYFLNTSKIFSLLKRKSVYFALDLEKSLEYLNNDEFRALVLSKVENGWKQISLQFFNSPNSFSPDFPAHQVKISIDQPKTLFFFSHIESLQIGLSDDREVPLLPNMKKLVIEGAGTVTSFRSLSHLSKVEINNASNLIDLTPIKGIPHIHLGECHLIKDFKPIGNGYQKYLSLSKCPCLTDVSPFRNIRTLILSECDKLKDVSPLHGIHHLKIAFCENLTDISGLGDHHRLEIWNCSYHLIGYSSLLNVSHVTLSGCNIVDLRVLESAESLRLTRCNGVVDVAPIASLKEIILVDCPGIYNVSELKEVPKLTLVQTGIAQNQFREMRNRSLSLYHLKVEDYSSLSLTRYLSIRSVTNLPQQIISRPADTLKHLQFLSLEDLEHY